MAKLKPGDRIDCRIKEAEIVSSYKDYDQIKTFEIVAFDKGGYYLYVPPYLSLRNTFTIDEAQCKTLSIDLRFLNRKGVYIKGGMVYKVNMVFDGTKCCRCHDFVHMAGPNQLDGTFLCWSCRGDPFR